MHWLIEPLQYGFMRQALIAGLLVGTTCSLLGVYVVLRRLAFLGVTTGDLVGILLVGSIVVGTLLVFHKELVLTSVDPSHSQVIGLSADKTRYLLLTLIAMSVVAAIQAVGVVLTTALLVTPAAAASLLTKRLQRMFALAMALFPWQFDPGHRRRLHSAVVFRQRIALAAGKTNRGGGGVRPTANPVRDASYEPSSRPPFHWESRSIDLLCQTKF
jgi:ABC-type Mn2+/Zn2+ transport system permease subunit